MSSKSSFFEELKRRNVIRAAILYLGAVWALAQGISQLGPSLDAPEWATRWFLVAAAIGFPFWIAFAWFFEFTPEGLKRESEIDPAESITHHTGRKLDFAIIGVLAVAVVLLLTDRFVLRHGVNETIAAPIAEKSIAVLPFENLSSDKENAYFTDGVQDEILTNLAKVADLKVISRTSVMQYKTGAARSLRKIGEDLGVAHVLEGSVQRAAKRIRVNVQLINARNDHHEWAENYDRDVADVFAIQTEIAKTIAGQLQAKLSPAEKKAIEQPPTSDLIAHDQYTRAVTLMRTNTVSVATDRKNLTQAIEILNGAVARDPSYYDAYVALVECHDALYGLHSDRTPERLAAAEAALQRAVELRPNAPQTHELRGTHLYGAYRNYKEALSELDKARVGLPNSSGIDSMVGFIMRRQGKHEEGVRGLKDAISRDPLNTYLLGQLSMSYLGLRRYPEAKAALQRVLEITPDDVGAASSLACLDLFWRADPAPLHRFIERLRAERPSVVGDVSDNWFACALAERDWSAAEQALSALGTNPCWTDLVGLSPKFGKGLLARAMHDDAQARTAFTDARVEQQKLVEKQKDYGPPLCVLGLIDAALGNKEVALAEGRRAMELLPVEKDSIGGEIVAAYFSLIAAWAGEKDLALQQLEITAPTFGACTIASYGVLKLLPFWDPLRGDPRFEKIVAFLAPKEPPK